MASNTLENYYRTNFAMKQFHQWDLDYLDTIPPFERDIYSKMLKEHLENMEEERRQRGHR